MPSDSRRFTSEPVAGFQLLGPAPADTRTVRQRLGAWLAARQARRKLAAKNVADLLDRFGPAAPAIARNCARRAAGREERKLWAMVVRRIGRPAPQNMVPTSEW